MEGVKSLVRTLTSLLSGVIIAVLLATIPEAVAASGWLRVQSPHFKLIGNVSEIELRSVANGLEEFLPAVTAQLPAFHTSSLENITFVVFSDQASWEPFRIQLDGAASRAAGYFLADNPVRFIAVVAGDETQRTLYHELFHALANRNADTPLPTWASEGMAEFYSTYDRSFGAVISSHVLTLRSRPWIPIASLLAATKDSSFYSASERLGVFYAESWALSHFLLAGDDGSRRNQLRLYLDLRAKGQSIESSASEAFGLTLADLEAELHNHVAGLQLNNGDTPLRQPDMSVHIQVSLMTNAESATRLGDLLLHLNRLESAAELLQPALQMNPFFPGTLTSMGLMRMRQDRNSDALPFLERAVKEDSANYLSHFYYASALQTLTSGAPGERKRRLDLSREHLVKTIELAPWFTEAAQWLEFVETARREFDQSQQREQDLARQRTDAAAKPKAEAAPPTPYPDLWSNWPPKPDKPPRPRIPTSTLDGFLIAIECRDGITLVVRASTGTVRFHTDTPRTLEFTSKVSSAADNAACGTVRPEQRVVVTFRRKTNGGFLGEPIKIEYK